MSAPLAIWAFWMRSRRKFARRLQKDLEQQTAARSKLEAELATLRKAPTRDARLESAVAGWERKPTQTHTRTCVKLWQTIVMLTQRSPQTTVAIVLIIACGQS